MSMVSRKWIAAVAYAMLTIDSFVPSCVFTLSPSLSLLSLLLGYFWKRCPRRGAEESPVVVVFGGV